MKIIYKNKYKYIEFLGDFSLHNVSYIHKLKKKKLVYRIINFETFFSVQEKDNAFLINSDKDEAIKSLIKLNVNCIAVANNHIFDGSYDLLINFLLLLKNKHKIDIIGLKDNTNFPNEIFFLYKNKKLLIQSMIHKESFSKKLKLNYKKKLFLDVLKEKKLNRNFDNFIKIIFLHGGEMFKQTQINAKKLSKKLNKNLFIIQCGSHIAGYYYKNFFSGIGNFVFNDMSYKYLNNYLPYKNSILEKIGVKVVYNIDRRIFLTEFFFTNYLHKRNMYTRLFSTTKMCMFNFYISFMKIFYPFFLYLRVKRYIKHRVIKHFN